MMLTFFIFPLHKVIEFPKSNLNVVVCGACNICSNPLAAIIKTLLKTLFIQW